MTLEQEKKLVTEKLNIKMQSVMVPEFGKEMKWEEMPIEYWNPNKERKWWDEIWEKMNLSQRGTYLNNLKHLENAKESMLDWDDWIIHIAKPEVCWKALILTLKEENNMIHQKEYEYIKNSGNPKVEYFIEDWEPVGQMVLDDLIQDGYAEIKDGHVFQTSKK